MFMNFLKITLRNLLRHKAYSFINIAGLAVGMACCVIIMLWVQDELSFDKFHQKANRIYRVVQDINFADHSTRWAITQGPLGPSLMADYSEIENFTRTWRSGQRLRFGETAFNERGMYVDTSFFQIFSFPLAHGNPLTSLVDPHSILLSERLAEKFFDHDDPIGKTINVNEEFDCTVTAVFEDVPDNSQMTFDYLFPMTFAGERAATVEEWGNSTFTTYVLLRENVSAIQVVERISGYLYDKPTLEEDARLNLQPLTEVHLRSNFEFEHLNTGDIRYIYIFSFIALCMLLIACINFMNLTTARSADRAREVGLRKVVGARKSNLISQFFSESVLLTLFALCLTILLVELALPLFNELSGKHLTLSFLSNAETLLGLLTIVLLTAILSGSYPALFLAAFQPAQILKGVSSSRMRSVTFRRIMVVTQFVISVALIIAAIGIYNQLHFMRNRYLGYDKENVIYFS